MVDVRMVVMGMVTSDHVHGNCDNSVMEMLIGDCEDVKT